MLAPILTAYDERLPSSKNRSRNVGKIAPDVIDMALFKDILGA